MVILGLTGSIGMGKSNAANVFRRMGIPVYDADAEVHRLLAAGGAAVPLVAEAFAGVVRDGAVDRAALGQRVFADVDALRRLEAILHPMVWRCRTRFLQRASGRRCPLVVIDIPLLFETGAERDCDAVVLVTAPPFVQEARVLRRRGMSRERLRQVRAQQMPERAKRRRADFIVNTGLDRRATLRQLCRIVETMRWRRGRKWPPPSCDEVRHARDRR